MLALTLRTPLWMLRLLAERAWDLESHLAKEGYCVLWQRIDSTSADACELGGAMAPKGSVVKLQTGLQSAETQSKL